MERRLYRSRRDRMIAGVCGGIAEYFEVDPTIVRMAAVILSLVTFGTAVIAYLIMAIVVPEEPPAGEGSVSEMAPPPDAAVQAPPPPPTSPPPGAPPMPPPPAPAAPNGRRRRPGRGGIVFGVVLVLLGLALLLGQFVPGIDLWRLWPLIVIAIGIRVMFRGGGED